jgi:integrase
MPRITKRFVDSLKPPTGKSEVVHWDDDLPCFGVRVRASGAATYIVQYRNAERITRKVKVGIVGRMAPDQARSKARQQLAAVDREEDPANERARRRRGKTVKELCGDYMVACGRGLILNRKGEPKKQSTIKTDTGRVNRHIVPLLGRRHVEGLAQADVKQFMRDVIAGKTAVVEKTKPRGKAVVTGGSGTAARTVGLLGGILSYAVEEGIIATNPVRGVVRPADNKRQIRLSSEDYEKVGTALADADRGGENPAALAAVKLLLLTGARKGEIENLQWGEIDIQGRCFRFTNTKTGSSVRPVGSPIFEVLQTLPRASDFVLMGRSPGAPYRGLPKAWQRIATRAGLPKEITLHVFRHTFASICNDLGLTEPTIAALIGHSSGGGTTRRYIHHLDEALLAAADRVSIHISNLLAGNTESSVVPISNHRKWT